MSASCWRLVNVLVEWVGSVCGIDSVDGFSWFWRCGLVQYVGLVGISLLVGFSVWVGSLSWWMDVVGVWFGSVVFGCAGFFNVCGGLIG